MSSFTSIASVFQAAFGGCCESSELEGGVWTLLCVNSNHWAAMRHIAKQYFFRFNKKELYRVQRRAERKKSDKSFVFVRISAEKQDSPPPLLPAMNITILQFLFGSSVNFLRAAWRMMTMTGHPRWTWVLQRKQLKIDFQWGCNESCWKI